MKERPQRVDQKKLPNLEINRTSLQESGLDSRNTEGDARGIALQIEQSKKIQALREKLGVGFNFADSLEPTSFDARNIKLWKLANDSGKLARESIVAGGQTLDELERNIRESVAQFNAMRVNYGIHVVSMNITREKNREGADAIFTVVDNIEGKNLSEIEELPDEATEEFESLYLGLSRHYYDSWKKKLPYWGDCRSDQFVYGARQGEKEKHVYLIDVDPEFYREGDDKWHTLEAVLGSVCHDLIESEGKFRPKARFEKARKKLLSVIQEMLREHPDWEMLREAKGWLER